jgi:hypothetical protein
MIEPFKWLEAYSYLQPTPKRRNIMAKLIEMWLNPINLGIFFLCLTGGLWILTKCGPDYREK